MIGIGRPTGSGLLTVQALSVLDIAHINLDTIQFIFSVDTLPVTANGPNRPISKGLPVLSQDASAVCLQLITDFLTRDRLRADDCMDMIRACIDGEQFPAAIMTNSLTGHFDSSALFGIEKSYLVPEPIATPFGQEWPAGLLTLAAFPPTALRALKMRAVNGPGDEIRERFIAVHRKSTEPRS